MKLSPIAKHYHESRNKDVNENSDQNTLIKASAYSAYQLNKPALALKIIAAKNTRDGEIRDNAGLCTRLHYRLTEQFRLGWAKEIKAKDSEILDPGGASKPVFDRASYPFLNAVQRGGSSEINNAQPPSDKPPGDKPPSGQPPAAQSQGGHDLNPNPPPDLNNQYDVPAPDAADVADAAADAADAADAAAADAPEQPQEPVENLPHNLNPNLVVAPEPAPTPPPTPPGSPADAAIELAESEAEINDDGSEGKGGEAGGSASRSASPSPSEGRTGLNFGGDPKTPEASPPSSPTAPSSPVFERKNDAASDSSGEGESEKGTDSRRKSRGGSGASSHSGSIKPDDSEGSEGAAGGRAASKPPASSAADVTATEGEADSPPPSPSWGTGLNFVGDPKTPAAPPPSSPTWPPAPSASPSLPVGGGGRDRGASGRGSPSSGDERKNTQPFQPRKPRPPRQSPQERVTLKKEFVNMSKTELLLAFETQFGNSTSQQITEQYEAIRQTTKRGSPDFQLKARWVEQIFNSWAIGKGVRL